MARKEKDVLITDADSRDVGKRFHLKEMDADRAEDWAIRALLAIAKGGVDIPAELPRSIAGIAILGFKTILSGMDYSDAKPLLNEMLGCVMVIPAVGIPRSIHPGEIEEVATYYELRKEVFELHTGFFARVARLNSTTSQSAAATGSATPSA